MALRSAVVATSARLEDDSIPRDAACAASRNGSTAGDGNHHPTVHELIHHLKRLEAYDRREQIRVVVRQSRLGAATQQILASVVHTARLRGLDTRSVLVDLLRARHPIVSSALTATPQ